jgi:hypothetical protein
MRKLGVACLAGIVVFAGMAVPAIARPWSPRVEVSVSCTLSTGTYDVIWTIENTHPTRRMTVLSTTRDLVETVPGTTRGTLSQQVRVRWQWRAGGEVHRKRGSATATFELDGTCRVPVIEVELTSSTSHSEVSVYWGTISEDNSSTNILTPFNAEVDVDPDYDIVSMSAFEESGANVTLTCSITVDGAVEERSTASGAYSSCDVSHVFELSDPIPVEP